MKPFDANLLKKISAALKRKNETIAVAESVTAGLLQFALSNAPEGASFFQGGITVYNIAQKYKFLNVEPIHALSVNCVSEKIAAEMALNVCTAFKSHWGIGITGYATPSEHSGQKLFAFYAIASDHKIVAASKIARQDGEPSEIQREYTEEVLRSLVNLLH